MEIDTGAAKSVISDKTFTQLWPKDLEPPLKPTNAALKTYTAPVVPVVKRDGSVRLSGDYIITVNKIAKFDSYPLPHIDYLFASLSVHKTGPGSCLPTSTLGCTV